MQLQGKVAVITGAASGIGLALALHAAHAGMRVALADVEDEPLQAALLRVLKLDVRAIAVRTDVSDANAVQLLADTVADQLGAPWLVCNNAGVNKFKPMWLLTRSEWEWIVGVNMWGVINGISAFAPGMVDRDAGYIVNTASAAGLYVTPCVGPYVATKHAVVGLSECLYRELVAAGSAVGVSVVCPRLVATNMMTATRNEPGNTDKPSPIDMTALRSPVAGTVLDVHTPEMMAREIFAAIVARRFWVLPHAAAMSDIVTERFRQALAGENPNDDSADRLSSTIAKMRAGFVQPTAPAATQS